LQNFPSVLPGLARSLSTKLGSCPCNPVFFYAVLQKIVWQSSFELQPIFCHRMKKSQPPSVQHLPAELASRFSVDLVAQNRVPDRMEMDPNLMCSTSVNLA
jgi:hypothetical protein